MGHFVKWRGPNLHEGAPAIAKAIQYTEVGQAFRFGIWGGQGIRVQPNNPAIAQVNPRLSVEGSTNNILWYEAIGLREGFVYIDAFNPADNQVWDSFQLAVKKQTAVKRPTVKGISYDYYVDTEKIGPNYNASMVITLRVNLVRTNGKGAPPKIKDTDGKEFLTKNWSDGEWNQFVAKYRSLIIRNLNEKFWIKTPAAINELVVTDASNGKRYRVNLHCVLKLEIAAFANSHHRIPVVQATQSTGPGTVVVNNNTITFRSNSTLMDQKDINTDAGLFGSLTTTPFNTATHEVGHLLGLRHPFEGNPAAGAAGNSVYCVVGHPDCNTLMGLGNTLQTVYAIAWQKAAASWFNSAGKGYNFQPGDFVPSLSRLAPVQI